MDGPSNFEYPNSGPHTLPVYIIFNYFIFYFYLYKPNSSGSQNQNHPYFSFSLSIYIDSFLFLQEKRGRQWRGVLGLVLVLLASSLSCSSFFPPPLLVLSRQLRLRLPPATVRLLFSLDLMVLDCFRLFALTETSFQNLFFLTFQICCLFSCL